MNLNSMDNKKLYSKKDVKNMLRSENLHFKKSLGQNFLTDEEVLEDIVKSASVTENDYVLEIGPGPGVLTRALLKKAKKVVAVELDSDIIELLKKNTAEFSNIEIINEDILKLDLDELFKNHLGGGSFKVIANLPYYITTPIIMLLLESGLPISDIVVMIQKEVAERLSAEPGTKEFGAISLSVRYYSDAQIVRIVPPTAFVPEPKVFSAVLRLKMLDKPRVETIDEKYLKRLIKAAFSTRRKTFLNAISNDSGLKISKAEAKEIILSLGFDENLRGETLSLEQYAQISDAFCRKICEKKH